MGVVHKLRPEVITFILNQKKETPALGCRKLASLILEEFKAEVSKSSINNIIKEAGLSSPLGRTPKKKRRHITMPVLPILLENSSVKEALVEAKIEEVAEDSKREEEARRLEEGRWAKLAEEERLAKEAKEKARIEEERKKQEGLNKIQEEVERLKLAKLEEEERFKEEAQIKAEEEKWSRLAEEERLAKEAKEKAHIEEELRKQREEFKKSAEEAERLRLAQLEEEKRLKEESQKKAEEERRKPEELKKPQEGTKQVAVLNIDKFAQIENSGIILLKAADYIIGLSEYISSAIKSRLTGETGNLNDITENILYLPLLQDKIDKQVTDKLYGYLNELENIKVLNLDISRAMALRLQEVRCVKVILSDGSNLYLDGQMYSIWSSAHVPYDFASPVHDVKKRINRYLHEESPGILFNAPGYDMPSQEFLNFLLGLEGKKNRIVNIVLYGNKFEELEVLPITQGKPRGIIFGVWPWQYTECRHVKSMGEFRPFHLESQNRDFYIADIEIEIIQPTLGKQVVFTGCALKLSLSEKIRLLILSNYPEGEKKAEDLATQYLGRWPNLDEAFQDYSRKIELFTYTANSQRFFSAENLSLEIDQASGLKVLFKNYLTALDAYVRWHFLPSGNEDKNLADTRERFYNLGVRLSGVKPNALASFILPEGFASAKDLSYACRRVNEREIVLSGGQKLYLLG